MRKRSRVFTFVIVLILVAACSALIIWLIRPTQVSITALNAEGYAMADAWPQYPAVTRNGKLLLPFADPRFRGWSVMQVGDPLSLEYSSPLSSEPYEAQLKHSCPVGVDAKAAAALVDYSVAVRYPGNKYAVSWPLSVYGEFFLARLPGGGLALLQLPSGANPSSVKVSVGEFPVETKQITALEALKLQMEGEPSEMQSEMLEAAVIENDARALLAETDTQRSAALHSGCAVLRRILEAYKERNGSYPETLTQLVELPNAIISRLPLNPYSPQEQLGLESDPASLAGGVKYDPQLPELICVVDSSGAV